MTKPLGSQAKEVFLFVGFSLSIFFVLHSALIFGLRRYHTRGFEVWNDIVSAKAGADILVLGTSRALVNFDCQVIGEGSGHSCFNIGLDGSKADIHLPILKTYLRHNKAPRLLVQILGVNELENAELPRPYQFIPYLNEPNLYNYLVNRDPSFFYYRHIPLIGLAAFQVDLLPRAIRGLLHDTDFEEKHWSERRRHNGHLAVDLDWTEEFDQFKTMYPQGKPIIIDQKLVKALRATARYCQKENIPVVFTFSPAYFESFLYFTNLQEVFDTYREIAGEFAIPILDYSGIPLTQEKKYFYNSQHLNRGGAEKFSALFGQDLKKIFKP